MGVFMAFGFLTKYLFIYLIIAIKIIFLIKIKKDKKFNHYYFIPGIVFLVFITPHLIWLFKNDFVTISYALARTGIEEKIERELEHIYLRMQR